MTNTEIKDNKPGYDTGEVNVKKIIVVGLISAIVLAAILIGLYQFFIARAEKQIYESVLKPESVPLRDLRAREDEILNSYKLLDSTKKIYQIPIARAMQLLAEESARPQIHTTREN